MEYGKNNYSIIPILEREFHFLFHTQSVLFQSFWFYIWIKVDFDVFRGREKACGLIGFIGVPERGSGNLCKTSYNNYDVQVASVDSIQLCKTVSHL